MLCLLRNAINNFFIYSNCHALLSTHQTYTIRGLESNSVYEAIVQAKNQYGWNEVINSFNYDYAEPKLLGLRKFAINKFAYLINSQVSDIYQFYTQSNNVVMNEEEVEMAVQSEYSRAAIDRSHLLLLGLTFILLELFNVSKLFS